MIDSRAGRVLDARRRAAWSTPASGAGSRARHRRLRPPADRHVAAAVPRARRCTTSRRGTRRSCDGAWGSAAAKLGEKLRQGADLEHWPAFRKLVRPHVRAAAARSAPGERGEPPRDDRRAFRRRPPRLPGRGRLLRGKRGAIARLAGGLLAVPQPAGHERAARHPASAGRAGASAIGRVAGRARGRSRPAGALAAAHETSRGSTTRSRRSSSTSATRQFALEQGDPADDGMGDPTLERAFEHGLT